jgi:hypothetical protein
LAGYALSKPEPREQAKRFDLDRDGHLSQRELEFRE